MQSERMVKEMASLLKSTENTRAILPDSFRFVRSDVPNSITEQEIQWLISENITTVIDLREDTERERKKCPLTGDSRFQYYCMPVTGGNAVPESVEDVSRSYINMADAQMDKIIDTILNADSNVLYFCNAGKDRTGVVSAILLQRTGMNQEYIINDYLESGVNLKSTLEAYAKQFPKVNIEVITPKERYMREFLAWLATEYINNQDCRNGIRK